MWSLAGARACVDVTENSHLKLNDGATCKDYLVLTVTGKIKRSMIF